MKTLLALFAAAGLAGAAWAAENWTKEQQAVVGVFDAWAQAQPAWNQAPAKVTGLWMPDYTMWDLRKPAPMDRAGAEKMMTDFHARMKTTTFGITTESVVAKDGFAVANGHYAETYVTPTGVAMKGGGPWSATLVRSGGQWQVQAMSYLDRDSGPADPAVIEQHLVKLEQDWCKAYLARDVKVLGRIEADQWVCTSHKGELFSRAEDMADLESGTYAATEFKIENVKVRLHGDTAVVTGIQTERATYKGEDASGVFAITDTWQKQRDGSWQCIASQLTKLEKK